MNPEPEADRASMALSMPDVAPWETIGPHESAVVSRDMGDEETVLFQSDRPAFLNLNQAGSWLWTRCDGTSSTETLIADAISEFGWEPAEADPAVRTVLHAFVSKAFVKRNSTDRLTARHDRPYTTSTLEWIWSQRYEMLGVGVTFRSNDAVVAKNLTSLFAMFESPSAPVDILFSAVRFPGAEGDAFDVIRYEPKSDESRLMVDAGHVEETIMEALVVANSVAISRSAFFSFHAGGIAAGREVTIIPAKSNTGKSTLVAACLALGFSYVSDEAVAVDLVSGEVHPYAKPLWLRDWSRKAVGIKHIAPMWKPKRYKDAIVDPADLGPVVDRSATGLRTRRIVALEVRPGPPELTEMTPGETAAALVTDTFDKRVDPRRVFDTCVDMAAKTPGWKLAYSDPREAAQLLWQRFGVPESE